MQFCPSLFAQLLFPKIVKMNRQMNGLYLVIGESPTFADSVGWTNNVENALAQFSAISAN